MNTKKIKTDKGITMIALVMVVILLFILSAVTVYEANNVISAARVESTMTNLLLIQAKVRIINEKVVFEKDDEKKQELYVGTKLSESPNTISKIKEQQTENNKTIIENIDDEEVSSKYYVLSQKELNDFGLSTINASEGYIVNYETEEVIYVKGVQDQNEKILHTLTELLNINKEE